MNINRKKRFFTCLGFIFLSALASGQHTHDFKDSHHWEIPSEDPDRIILTFNGNPATSRAVTWRTNKNINKAIAQIAEATVNSKFEEKAISLEATTETCDIGLYKENKPLVVHYHNVTFENLKPDKLYAYRVGSDNHWSEWFQFRTAKDEYAPTEFVYFGDVQNDILSHWSRVIRMAYKTAPNASFAIHAGDLINTAHVDSEWAEWYKAGSFIHSQWTTIPVAGNHEYKKLIEDSKWQLSIHWRPQFTLPIEKNLPAELYETVYTIDYQNIRIIVLNSNKYKEEQTKYLEQQLKTSTAKWNIVTCHHSIFSPAEGRNFQFALDNWKPLLDKYNVDLVLNGHDHTYSRGHVPVRITNKKRNSKLGTVYVTSVSGPKLYKLDTLQLNTYSAVGYKLDKTAEQTQFFQVIKVEKNKLIYIAYNTLGEEYDRAVITKNFVTGRKFLE